jgi:TfoX/Sxy family transcriptional regulator of competence genes
MPTDASIVDFILDQLSSLHDVRARSMFGEYALYVEEKVVGLICDNQLFIKYTDTGKVFAQGRFEEGYAYPGAKVSMNVTDQIDDNQFLCELVSITAKSLPIAKAKKKKNTV